MTFKPLASKSRYLVKRSGLFEEMRCARNDHELLFATQLCESCPVQIDHRVIVPADNEQRWCFDMRQCRASKIRASAARDDGTYHIGALSRRHQRGGSAGACPEAANRKVLRTGALREPVGCTHDPFGEQIDVEAQVRRAQVDNFLFPRQQVDQKGPQPGFVEQARHAAIAWTLTSTAAAVSKQNNSTSVFGQIEVAMKRHRSSRDVYTPRLAY
jgi:hypothetical protein